MWINNQVNLVLLDIFHIQARCLMDNQMLNLNKLKTPDISSYPCSTAEDFYFQDIILENSP